MLAWHSARSKHKKKVLLARKQITIEVEWQLRLNKRRAMMMNYGSLLSLDLLCLPLFFTLFIRFPFIRRACEISSRLLSSSSRQLID
jgi:hypothetical protein